MNASAVSEAFDVEELVEEETPDVEDWDLVGLLMDVLTRATTALP
jgi:hypothetical protein